LAVFIDKSGSLLVPLEVKMEVYRHQFTVKNVAGDGSCLFRSLAVPEDDTTAHTTMKEPCRKHAVLNVTGFHELVTGGITPRGIKQSN
jgi:hypothetical protein